MLYYTSETVLRPIRSRDFLAPRNVHTSDRVFDPTLLTLFWDRLLVERLRIVCSSDIILGLVFSRKFPRLRSHELDPLQPAHLGEEALQYST